MLTVPEFVINMVYIFYDLNLTKNYEIMTKSNKLPQKKLQTITRYAAPQRVKPANETDTTSTSMSTITSTHIFFK
jgi:hypothetical protein